MSAPTPTTVVVAEDESLIRVDLVEMLTELGYDVVGSAGDGRAAVKLIEQRRPDVALVDIKMPVLDGLTVAEQVNRLGHTAVVMLTAFSQPELVNRANNAGVMAYLVKPITASDLRPAIELARSRFAERVSLTTELGELSAALESRKVIERAKGILQKQYGLDEPASFKWLQRAAMDRRMSMVAVAEVVLREAANE